MMSRDKILEKFLPLTENFDISDENKVQLIEDLWVIAQTCVDITLDPEIKFPASSIENKELEQVVKEVTAAHESKK